MKELEEFEQCAGRLRALTDSHRLQIIDVLFRGEATVSTLSTAVNLHITMASHHLGVLLKAGIVTSRKQGRFVYYALHPDVVPAEAGERLEKLDLGYCSIDFGNPDLAMQITGPVRGT